MKISCNACGASYGIADEKVAGRLVKVRCKNCGAAIVVDGREAHAAAPKHSSIPPAVTSPGDASEQWSVNLTETDSRTMTTAEIVQMYPTGQLDDAYVWKEGMDDWVPLLDVPSLAKAVAQSRSVPPPAAAAFGAGGGGAAALTTKQQVGAAPDLFGGVATAGSEAEAATATEFAHDARPVGARNENSVLFSLDALKAGVAPAAKPPARPAPMNPLASSGDGMSAIMNLSASPMFSAASNEALLMAPPPPEPPKPKPKPKIEEPVVASMAAPPPRSGNIVVVAIASVVGTLVVVGIVAFLFLGGSKDDEANAKKEEVAAADESKSASDTKASTKGDQGESAKDDDATKNDAKDDDAKKDDAKDDATKKDDDATKTKEELEAFKKASEEQKQAEAKKDDEKKAEATKTEPAKDEPKKDLGSFNKQAAIAALGAAAAQAAACKKPDGPTGTGRATVTFATSGRVTSANVSGGGFGGTAVGGCVASIFRRASVPPFSGGTVTVSKSFTIP